MLFCLVSFITTLNKPDVGRVSKFHLKINKFVIRFENIQITESKVYHFTKETGIQEFATKAYDRFLQGVGYVNKYAEDNFPEYYQTVVVFSEPYIQLSKDLALVTYNFMVGLKESLVAKYPAIIDSVS